MMGFMSGLRKKDVFSGALSALFDASFEKTMASLSSSEAKAASAGNLISGRMWIERETILISGVKNYAQELSDILIAYDPLHGAITSQNFEQAEVSIRKFSEQLEGAYEEKRNRKAFGYPESRPSFNGDRMAIALTEALLPIQLARVEFKSKRSVLKLAFGDARRQIFSGGLSLIMVTAGAFVQPHILIVLYYLTSVIL